MRKNDKKSINWLAWSILFLVLVIVGIFAYLISKEVQKKKRIESEINALREESYRIEKENLALEERISYLSSRDYQKMQAKDKLNLQSPDEKVIFIAEGPIKKEEPVPNISQETREGSSDEPNYRKWWFYFFK